MHYPNEVNTKEHIDKPDQKSLSKLLKTNYSDRGKRQQNKYDNFHCIIGGMRASSNLFEKHVTANRSVHWVVQNQVYTLLLVEWRHLSTKQFSP